MSKNPTDTNQASEDELRESIDALLEQVIHIGYVQGYNQLAQMAGVAPYNHIQPLEPEEAKTAIQELIRTEKLKLLDKFENDCKYNYTTFGNSEKMLQVSGLLKRIEAERTKLEAEL